MAAPIPGLSGPNDPRLDRILEQPPRGFGHKITDNIWSVKNKKCILESIQNDGQLHANVCYLQYPKQQWIVEPGQTRWLALYHLKMQAQKVIVCVQDVELEKFKTHFSLYPHISISLEETKNYLYPAHFDIVVKRHFYNLQKGERAA